ncbi:MAG: hypothetical protein ABSF67_23930, partial [Roseiarcus sp.]
ILDSRSGLEKRAQQELDGKVRSAALKSAKTGVSRIGELCKCHRNPTNRLVGRFRFCDFTQ